jgi:hypothetical protein
MTPKAIDWDEDLPEATGEERISILTVRTLRTDRWFPVVVVECVPSEGERLIAKVKQISLRKKRLRILCRWMSQHTFTI